MTARTGVVDRWPARTERVYRVVGRGLRRPYARTWFYRRLVDAERRAEEFARRGRLVAFDVADVVWTPINQSRFPRADRAGSGGER